MTKKDKKYYINSVDKAVTIKRTDSNFKRSSTMGKMSSNKQHCMLQRNLLWKEESIKSIFILKENRIQGLDISTHVSILNLMSHKYWVLDNDCE